MPCLFTNAQFCSQKYSNFLVALYLEIRTFSKVLSLFSEWQTVTQYTAAQPQRQTEIAAYNFLNMKSLKSL